MYPSAAMAIGGAAAALTTACSIPQETFAGMDPAPAAPAPVVFLQRTPRNSLGNIFQYTSYTPGARLVRLDPGDATGAPTAICCDRAGPAYSHVDIESFDVAFDAASIVFSAKLAPDQHYGLYLLALADGSVAPLTADPAHDYVAPIFLPGGRVLFTTNAVVEPGARQFEDEVERSTTSQLGRIRRDGTGLELGPRNLSHRTAPALASDGRVVFTQWDALGPSNQADLLFVDQDMTALHEGFGKEGSAASNSTLRAREISPGRFVAVATARNGTVGAGALIDIRLGQVRVDGDVVSAPDGQSEATATHRELTPDVPLDDAPSSAGIGRYHDAYPLDARDQPDLLVSWADGPVQDDALAAAGQTANFGIYRHDSAHHQRTLIFDDPDRWDLFPQPLRPRPTPPVTGSTTASQLVDQTLVGSLDVYLSTLYPFAPGQVYGVRVMEGFSSEEGFPSLFGTTGFEGHANLGVAPVDVLGSWAARIPPNIPVHLQAIDVFGMALFTEPVWISGRPGEAMVCGGCHEDRAHPVPVAQTQIELLTSRATQLFASVPRSARLNRTPVNPTSIVGVAWDTMLQPMFDAKCVTGCHDAANSARVPGYTITDPATGNTVTWTLDLTGSQLPAAVVNAAGGGAFSASYFSLVGPDMRAVENRGLVLGPTFKAYLNPLDAHGSLVIQKLNPTQMLPTINTSARAFPITQFPPHLTAMGKTDLTPTEFYLLILAADMGGNFYARENKPSP